MKIYVLKISDIKREEKQSAIMHIIPENIKAEWNGFKNIKRKNEFLAGRYLAVKALKDAKFEDEIVFSYGKKGKPYVEEAPFFSIAHDGDFAVCVCGNEEIGIDIAKISRFCGKKELKVFSEKEKNALKATANQDVKTATLWAMKEAFVKKNGEGVNCMKNMPDLSAVVAEKLVFGNFNVENVQFFNVEMDGHIISVCSENADTAEVIFC